MLHNLFYFISTVISIFVFGYAYAGDNFIVVNYDKEIGQINKKIFGNMMIGHDPAVYNDKYDHHYNHIDYGAGVWNPGKNESVKEVIDLAKNAGISIIRFSNGNYPWKKTIGKGRKHYLFGMDEFLKTTEEIGAEPLILLNYFIDNEQEVADLVEYLNAPCDGEHPWAARRAENGHPDPYNVKYFELGNEIYNNRFGVTPEEYAYRYLKYREAMKAVDPAIQLGIVLYNNEWNRRTLQVVQDKVDYGILHMYPTPVWGEELEKIPPLEIFSLSLSLPPLRYDDLFQEILELTKDITGKELPIAVTEYNGGFAQDKPVPYRFSLGTALINAELLRILMKPVNRILLANHFHFSNAYWGMIKSKDDYMMHDYRKTISYIKRPNYYVYEFYNRFGDILIDVDVKSGFYNITGGEKYGRIKEIITKAKRGSVAGENLLNMKWDIRTFPGTGTEEKNGILEINFESPAVFNYHHSFKKTKIQPNSYYRLSGYMKTENLIDKKGICLEVQDGRGWKYSVDSTEKIMGTNDWQFLHIVFKTLPDADSVVVMVRRTGYDGPLMGKVFIKDVKLERFDPDIRVPYLSVNASKSGNGEKVYLMVINKNMTEDISAHVEIRDFSPWEKIKTTSDKELLQVESWILNGPSIESTNEKKSDNVKVVRKRFEINDSSFELTFERHSLTAIEIRTKNFSMPSASVLMDRQ